MKKFFVAVALVMGFNRQGSGGGSGRGWQQDLSGCSDRQGGS